MARFELWARAPGARERKLWDGDALGPPYFRSVRIGLRQALSLYTFDTAASSPGLAVTMHIGAREALDIDPGSEA